MRGGRSERGCKRRTIIIFVAEASGSPTDKKLPCSRASLRAPSSPLSSAARNYWGRVAAQSSNYKHYSNRAALTQHAEAGENGNKHLRVIAVSNANKKT